MNGSYFTNTFALVACGGQSSRMGTDKSMLQYYGKPQCYHVYELLQPLCQKVFISCKAEKAGGIENGYNIIPDNNEFDNIGPMATLLSGFTKFPEKNTLLIGCDYPFITAAELVQFATFCKDAPAAFYNEAANMYEPLLAWYPAASFALLKEMHKVGQFSLQHFLNNNNAVKYYPVGKNAILSVDTHEDFVKVSRMLMQ